MQYDTNIFGWLGDLLFYSPVNLLKSRRAWSVNTIHIYSVSGQQACGNTVPDLPDLLHSSAAQVGFLSPLAIGK